MSTIEYIPSVRLRMNSEISRLSANENTGLSVGEVTKSAVFPTVESGRE